jgi:hypothetical protein
MQNAPSTPAAAIDSPAASAVAERAATHRAATIAAVQRVAELRTQSAEVTGEVAALEAALFESEAYKTAKARRAQLAAALLEAETVAKQAGVDLYGITFEKKPAPGVGIRVNRSARYDAAQALTWAREKKLFLIPEQLDAKALDKMLLGLSADAPPIGLDFSVEETPTATLAADLAAALQEAGVDGNAPAAPAQTSIVDDVLAIKQLSAAIGPQDGAQ